jgi:DNA polymerase III delta subunit
MQHVKPLHEAILNGDVKTARTITEQVINAGKDEGRLITLAHRYLRLDLYTGIANHVNDPYSP